MESINDVYSKGGTLRCGSILTLGARPLSENSWSRRVEQRRIGRSQRRREPPDDLRVAPAPRQRRPERAWGSLIQPAPDPRANAPASDPPDLKAPPPAQDRLGDQAECFIQTLKRRWAYRHVYRTSAIRVASLRPWITHYNHHRRHRALEKKAPMVRLREACERRTQLPQLGDLREARDVVGRQLKIKTKPARHSGEMLLS
jgi:hypothetical protein